MTIIRRRDFELIDDTSQIFLTTAVPRMFRLPPIHYFDGHFVLAQVFTRPEDRAPGIAAIVFWASWHGHLSRLERPGSIDRAVLGGPVVVLGVGREHLRVVTADHTLVVDGRDSLHAGCHPPVDWAKTLSNFRAPSPMTLPRLLRRS